MTRVLIPLPRTDFDPTESGVPWEMLTAQGIAVTFATPDGKKPACDPRMISGEGLGMLKTLLIADPYGRNSYSLMSQSQEFQKPIRWDQIEHRNYSGLLLPGGHAPGMRSYLESKILQQVTSDFFKAKKIIGAICHGVVLAARSPGENGFSVLSGYNATALLKSQELSAWMITRLWLKNYYRTYIETVQAEVTRNLGSGKFIEGPLPFRRDSPTDLTPGFFVEDRNLITARWPGDAHAFSSRLSEKLLKRQD